MKQIIVIVLTLAAAFGIVKYLKANAPKPPKQVVARELPAVEVLVVRPKSVPVSVASQGVVQPLTETRAAGEVPGRIIQVSPFFKAGGQFQEGEVMLEIDPSDYQAAVAQATAALAEANLAVEAEHARMVQAKRDWNRLAPSEQASGFVKREPHLASAEARVKAAEAAVAKARHDLERTKLRAPYPCRLRSTRVDLGDYVTPAAPLAEFYRLDAFEVRLPITLDEYGLLEPNKAEAVLSVSASGGLSEWPAKIIRTEGLVETSTRSIHMVARIEGEGLKRGTIPLSPGLFVKAKIGGRALDNVFPIPRKGLYTEDQVIVVDEKDELRLRPVKVAWSDQTQALIREGLKPEERVCLTSLTTVIAGTKVKVLEKEEKK